MKAILTFFMMFASTIQDIIVGDFDTTVLLPKKSEKNGVFAINGELSS